MEDEETEKVNTMVKPKPSFMPRRMQMVGESVEAAAKRAESRTGAGSATAQAKKADAVYTPASDSLLEVGTVLFNKRSCAPRLLALSLLCSPIDPRLQQYMFLHRNTSLFHRSFI